MRLNLYNIRIISSFVLASVSMSVMDSLQFHSLGADNQFWDPSISWTNKYKDYPEDQSAKFIGSKTAFVFLTDGWHLSQFFMLSFFALGAIPKGLKLRDAILWFLGLKIGFGLVFTLFFHYIF